MGVVNAVPGTIKTYSEPNRRDGTNKCSFTEGFAVVARLDLRHGGVGLEVEA